MSIHPYKNQIVQKYLELAQSLAVSQKVQPDILYNLNKSEKIVLTHLVHNINVLCKMTKKEVIEFVKNNPAYQPVVASLYFDSSINNYRLIINHKQQSAKKNNTVLSSYKRMPSLKQQCYHVDYRIQFTISNINNQKVMKPVICLLFKLTTNIHRNQQTDINQYHNNNKQIFSVYLSIDQFSQLRYKCAEAMKSIYAIQMRTLF